MRKRWLSLILAVMMAFSWMAPVAAASSLPEDGPGFLEKLRRFVARERLERRRPRQLMGTVVSVDGDTMLVETRRGDVTVQTDPLTRFVSPEGPLPDVSAVEVGNFVIVRGKKTPDGIQADLLVVLLKKPQFFQGDVVSIDDDTFRLATADEEIVVIADDNTRYRLPGAVVSSLEALNVGDTVRVLGIQIEESGEVLARLVMRARLRAGWIEGNVVAVDSTTLTLDRRTGGEVVLQVTESTEFTVPEVTNPDFEDVSVGDHVHARVVVEDKGPVALNVKVIPPDAAALAGEVVRIEEDTLVIQTRLEQEIAVEVEDTTRIVVPGTEIPSLSDVWVGDRVRVNGAWQTADRFTAWQLNVGAKERLKRTQGRILSRGDGQLTLGTIDGTLTVRVDEETRYQLQDIDTPGFEDLETGWRIAVRGVWQKTGDLLARDIRELH